MLTQLKDFYLRLYNAALDLSLPTKCGLLFVVIIGIQSLLLLAASAKGNAQIISAQQNLFAQQWADLIAVQAQPGLLQNDRLALLTILRQNLENPLLAYASISDSDGQVLVEAGTNDAALREFNAPIMLGKDIAGKLHIAVDTGPVQADQRSLTTQLIVLIAVLTGLAAALVVNIAGRADSTLRSTTHSLLRPSEEVAAVSYNGRDSFGDLIRVLQQRQPLLPALQQHETEKIVLQLRWSNFGRLTQQWGKAELEKRLNRSYQTALSLSRLYHGELRIHRRDSITLLFNEIPGADHPLLRALFCAWLLQAIDRDLGALPAIGLIRMQANRFQVAAAEAALIQSLAELNDAGIQLRLPSDLTELAQQWIEENDSGITDLQPRYRELLEKQLNKLSGQLG